MTCVIGIAQGGKVWMGADSQVSRGWQKDTLAMLKVFHLAASGLLIGYAGEMRGLNILRNAVSISQPFKLDDSRANEQFIFSVAEQCRIQMRECGYIKTDQGKDQVGGEGCDILIGFRGKLYAIGSDFVVICPERDFFAVGSGSKYALGALSVMSRRRDPRNRILHALEVAAEFCMGTSGPFTVECF